MESKLLDYFDAILTYYFNNHNQNPNFFDFYTPFEKSTSFIFDMDSDKFRYFCSSIKNLTGNNYNEFLFKGILYFKSLIHPTDYPNFISELFTYVLLVKGQKESCKTNNKIKDLTCRIRHKNGNWIRINIYVLYRNPSNINILTGILCEKESLKNNPVSFIDYVSKREREVLQLIGNGDSSKIIADKLHISETTAITHRKNLIQKLQVKNTAELIKKAAKAQIIE